MQPDDFVVFRRCCSVGFVAAVYALALSRDVGAGWSLWWFTAIPAAFFVDAVVITALKLFMLRPGAEQRRRRVEARLAQKASASRRAWFGLEAMLGLVTGVAFALTMVAAVAWVDESIADKIRLKGRGGVPERPADPPPFAVPVDRVPQRGVPQ